MGQTSTAQLNYRVRSDDGQTLNADAGWAAALNAGATIDMEQRFRIRFEIAETSGGMFNGSFKLQYNLNSGGWNDVPTTPLDWGTRTATNRIEAVDSKQYTGGDATTNLLSGSGLSFTAGEGIENDNTTGNTGLSSAHTELEFCLLLHRVADGPTWLDDGDIVQFRVVESDGTLLDTYSNIALVTVNYPAGLIGGCYVENPMRVGPFIDGNGNLYCMVEAAETDNILMMMKSSDGGDTWAEVDAAGRPADTDMEGLHIVQSGTQLLVFHHPGSAWNLHVFDTSDAGATADTWTTTDENMAGTTLVDYADQGISGFERSDGTLVFVASGDDVDPAASPFEIWFNIRSPAGVWGTPQKLWEVTGRDFVCAHAVMDPANDHIYVFSVDYTASPSMLFGKRINGATDAIEDLFGNASSAAADGTQIAATLENDEENVTPPVFFGSNKILVGWVNQSSQDLETVVITVGSGGSVGSVGGAVNDSGDVGIHYIGSHQPAAMIFYDDQNATWYCFFSRIDSSSLDSPLWYTTSTDDGATWGADTQFSKRSPKSRINNVRGNIYNNGSDRVIGFFYDDANSTEQNNDATGGDNTSGSGGYATGFIWYDEFVLPAGSAAILASASDSFQFAESETPVSTLRPAGTDVVVAGDTPTVAALLAAAIDDGLLFGDLSAAGSILQVSAGDGVSVGETIVAAAQLVAAIDDALTFGEAVSVLGQLVASGSDGLALAEALSVAAILVAAAGEGVRFGDSALGSTAAAIQALATDGLLLGESQSPVMQLLATIADGLQIGETAARGLRMSVDAVDGLQLGGDPAKQATFRLSSIDSAQLGENIAAIALLAAAANDGVSLGEVLSAIGRLAAAGGDGLALGETIARTLTFAAVTGDGITLSDSAATRAQLVGTGADSLTLGEAVSVAAILLAAASDELQTGESVATSLAGMIEALAADGFVLGESVAPAAQLLATIADGLRLGETIGAILQLVAAVQDGFALGDSAAGAIGAQLLSAVATDGLGLGDVTTATAILAALAQEGLDLGDLAGLAGAIVALGSDQMDLGDGGMAAAILSVLGQERLNFGDLASLATLVSALASDRVDFGDVASIASVVTALASDEVLFGDDGQVQATFVVSPADGIEFAETLQAVMALAAVVTDGFSLGDVSATIEARGLVSITFSARAGSVKFVVKKPEVGTSSRQPGVTVSGEV